MLVLSRRLNEKVVFPDFNTAVQILSINGSKVRLGIEAPPSVTVLREELQMQNACEDKVPGNEPISLEMKFRKLNHLLRNRLNVASLGLALLARQLDAGMAQDARITLDKIHDDFELLRARLETEMEAKHAPAPGKIMRARRALLVEDDQNERELLAGFLRMSGLQVDVAGDGTDALDYLRSHDRPDVLLMDMILPHCDGVTTIRAIRRDPANRDLKIFAVTGHAPETFHVEGVNRWFRKPLNPEALLHDLSEELEAERSAV